MRKRSPDPRPPWLLESVLYYGGVQVGRIWSFDRATGEVDCTLLYEYLRGSDAKVKVGRMTGRRRFGDARTMTAAEVRAEVEARATRAGVCFGTPPVRRPRAKRKPEAVEPPAPAVFEVGAPEPVPVPVPLPGTEAA